MLRAWEKLASEICRDFSPGIIDSPSTRSSALGTSPLRVSARTPASSAARSSNHDNRTPPGLHGTPLGPPWDLDGTSERLTGLEMRLCAKSPKRKICRPGMEASCTELALSATIASAQITLVFATLVPLAFAQEPVASPPAGEAPAAPAQPAPTRNPGFALSPYPHRWSGTINPTRLSTGRGLSNALLACK
jgi:hypothetical protein